MFLSKTCAKEPDSIFPIKTKMHSALLKTVLGHYAGITINVGSKVFTDSDVNRILLDYDTNGKVRELIKFEIIKDGIKVFMLYDNAYDIFIDASDFSLINKLKEQNIIKHTTF